MKKQQIFSLAMSALVAGSLLTGCATTELQTKAKLTRTILIDHSAKENKNIYLQVTNTAGSGGENMQLYKHLKENLEAKGYSVVNKSSIAGYGLFVNVLFANNLKEANAIKAGANLGMAGGIVAGLSGSGSGNSLLIGAGAALAGATIGKVLEDEVFRAVVDIRIRDYQDTLVETNKLTSGGNSAIYNTTRAGELNRFVGKLGDKNGAGDMADSTTEVTSTTTMKNYEEFKTRAFVEATKMNLKTDEALPILEAKISRQIANLF